MTLRTLSTPMGLGGVSMKEKRKEKGMQIMTRARLDHLLRDPKRKDEVRDNYQPMQVWAPQITEAERKERAQQVANGTIPF